MMEATLLARVRTAIRELERAEADWAKSVPWTGADAAPLYIGEIKLMDLLRDMERDLLTSKILLEMERAAWAQERAKLARASHPPRDHSTRMAPKG